MRFSRAILLMLVGSVVALGGVNGQAPRANPCGSPPNENVCLGRLDVPENQRATFVEASRIAIDALYSEQFERDFRAFVATHAHSGSHAAEWADVDPDATLAALRRAVSGQNIETYGGLIGWFKYRIFGNMAYDGADAGPIRVNRAAFPRSTASLANTIAHEVAHRIGLSHSRRGRSQTARCEPPYVIGSLVEKAIEGGNWERSGGDCELLV